MRKTPIRRSSSSRRTRGRFSGRLSNLQRKGRHRTFRLDPEFFRFVVESLEEYAILTMDRELTISSWNRGAEQIFAYREEEIIGRRIGPLFTEEDQAQGYPDREFEEALEYGRVDDERWHVAKGGRRFWSYGLSFPLKDERGRVRGFVKIVRDETERKKADVELNEKEERLRLAVQATGMGTWDYRPDRRTLDLSLRCKELLGFEPHARPSYDDFLARLEPQDRGKADHMIRSCRSAGRERCEIECRVRTDAGPRWIVMMIAGLDGDPRVKEASTRRVIGMIVDSTEKKRLQVEAAAETAELERRVRERTSSLEMATKELESFAYSASHDLRTPLRKLQLFSQKILETQRERLDPSGRDYLDRLRVAAAEMHALIDATLELSRATRKPMTLEEIDLSALASDVVEAHRRSDPGRRVRVEIEPGLSVRGDRELLTLALRHLLDNAWKFTRPRAEAVVEFGVRRQSGADVYFVRDNGAGFDMAHADKLFRAFERLHPRGAFSGAGVGLGVVDRVIKRHRGRAWAESRPEKGATFFFTLFSEAV